MQLSLDFGDSVSKSMINDWSVMSQQSSAKYRMLCNHMTLLNRYQMGNSEVRTFLYFIGCLL